MPEFGEWGWFGLDKRRVGVVLGSYANVLLIAYGTGTDRGPPQVTVDHRGRLGRLLGLEKPTHFQPGTIVKVLASVMERSCGHGPPGVLVELRALFPDIPPSQQSRLVPWFPVASEAPDTASRPEPEPDPEKP